MWVDLRSRWVKVNTEKEKASLGGGRYSETRVRLPTDYG